MLLLHVSVECGIAKIRLVAVLALEIAAVHVVLGPPLGLVLIVSGAASVL